MADLDFTATRDFIVDLFCRIDDAMTDVAKHRQAKLFPSEIVTLGFLFALKGCGGRAFDRWANGNLRGFFPGLPHQTRVMRLLTVHQSLIRWIN